MKEQEFNEVQWSDLFLLVALGQYKVFSKRLNSKIDFYVKNTGKNPVQKNFLVHYSDALYFRLHQRISFMKREAYESWFGKKRQLS